MRQRSPLDYDVSVSADKRRRTRRRGMSGVVEGSERCCEWPGCESHAAYRAPHSPEVLDRFRWFCLDHVRAYNAGWNYFARHSEEELDHQLRADRTWERPTWRLGQGPAAGRGLHGHVEGRAWSRWGFRDPLEVLGDAATINAGPEGEARPRRRLTGAETMALEALSLGPEVETRAEVRARYRQLVKELHPDMNQGESPDRDRLERVLKAWEILKASRSFRD